MFKVVFLIVGVLMLSYFMLNKTANAKQVESSAMTSQEWEHLYFYGLTKQPLTEIALNQGMTSGLISMIGVKNSISTGALIDPIYMLNKKGVTPWLAMYTLLAVNDKNLLNDIYQNDASAFIPNKSIEEMFQNHNNWPLSLLSKYEIEIDGYNTFILAFLVPKNTKYNLHFPQSMKAPDNSLEIFGVAEFDEKQPEALLSEIQDTINFIKEHRPDVYTK